MSEKTKIEFEESSGNVFADLGFEQKYAEKLQMRGLIGYHILSLLQEKNLEEYEIGALLGIKQTEISDLLNGHFSRFSMDKLLDFLKKMEQKVTIQISPHKKGDPYHQVSFTI